MPPISLLLFFFLHTVTLAGQSLSSPIPLSHADPNSSPTLQSKTTELAKKQAVYPCQNDAYAYLSQVIGTWKVKTKDRTSPGQYEDNQGTSVISPSIPGCGIKESFRGTYRAKEYAREVTIIGHDSMEVEMIALDSEHASFSELNGKIVNGVMMVYWFRDKTVRRLQSRYILEIAHVDQFSFSSFLSMDYGATWALTHERKYFRLE